MKFWGWGYEDQQPSRAEVTAAAEGMVAHLGFGDADVETPVALEDVSLPDPRLAAPAALGPICSSDTYDRASHALGKAYRDVVRGFRGQFEHPPDVVARPRDEADVERVLDWCSDAGALAVPFGGGTSVVGGVEPREADGYSGSVSIDLKRLDRVLEIDRVSRTARIQAGALGPALEQQLQTGWAHAPPFPAVVRVLDPRRLARHARGRTLRHRSHPHRRLDRVDPRDHARRSLGEPAAAGKRRRAEPGPHAARLGGHARRDHRGLDAASGSAALARVGRCPLRFLRARRGGCPGALAVRSLAVELPSARSRRGRTDRCRDRRRRVARARVRIGRSPARCMGHSARSSCAPITAVVARTAPSCRARRTTRAGEAKASERGATRSSRLPTCATPSWRRRFSPRRSRPRSPGTSCPTSSPPSGRRAEEAVAEICGAGRVSCRFTHVYPDGPAPYFTVLAPAKRGSEVEQWAAIKAAVSEALIAGGGTITHHHAVGRDHRPWYDSQRPEPFAAVLRAAKSELDPGWVLNPGVLVDR